MRKELEGLATRIENIDYDNLYQAIVSIKGCLLFLTEQLDKALPIDKSDDV